MDGEGLLPGTDRWNDALLRQVHSAHPTLLQRLEFATLTHPSAGPPCRALLADDEVPSTADIDRARHALEVNVLGPWRTCEAFLPLLRRSGAGRIVNVSSGSGAFA